MDLDPDQYSAYGSGSSNSVNTDPIRISNPAGIKVHPDDGKQLMVDIGVCYPGDSAFRLALHTPLRPLRITGSLPHQKIFNADSDPSLKIRYFEYGMLFCILIRILSSSTITDSKKSNFC